jgi:hypothetical protein
VRGLLRHHLCVEATAGQQGARGANRFLVGLHTDSRAASLSSKLNPMVPVPLERIAESEDDLLEILECYRSEEQTV